LPHAEEKGKERVKNWNKGTLAFGGKRVSPRSRRLSMFVSGSKKAEHLSFLLWLSLPDSYVSRAVGPYNCFFSQKKVRSFVSNLSFR